MTRSEFEQMQAIVIYDSRTLYYNHHHSHHHQTMNTKRKKSFLYLKYQLNLKPINSIIIIIVYSFHNSRNLTDSTYFRALLKINE